jgi:hypothetical protein
MANTLDKSGIINGQTIQPIHVTQTIDALTAADAYDITISGSLTLTGSVSSLNGFTGDLVGTASRATEASITTQVRPSNTVSDFGYTLPYLSGTGSLATMYYSATGPTYNPTTETITSANFEGTASLATTASFAETYADPTFVDGPIYPSGSVSTPGSALKIIAGASQTDGTSTANVTVNELTGKTLNQNCFITAMAEDASPGAISIDPSSPPPNLSFKSQNPNTKFHFHILYV